MIKVCHMTSVHPSNDVRIFFRECTSLQNSGRYKVCLIAPGDSYERNGVTVLGLPMLRSGRLVRVVKTGKAIYQKALKLNADIYHFHDPELLPYALKLKKRGKKVIYDVHEDFPINIRAKDYLPKIVRSAIAKVFEIYEKRKASRFDAVITVTPQIVERFQRYGAPTALVTNFPIVEDDLPKHERQDGIKILCFAGAVSPSRMHHVVVKAIQSMEGVCYQIAGKDTSQGAKYTDELKVLDSNSRLQLLGRLDRTDVLQLYERSTIGIALVDPDYSPLSFDGKGSIGATKLFEYMEAGLPLICQNYDYWKEIVESNHCGIAVDSRNVDEVARAIRYLLDHEEEALEMGRNGQKAILEKYNWESQEKALLDIYRRVEET